MAEMVMVVVVIKVMVMVVVMAHVLGVEPPGEQVGGGHHPRLPGDEAVQALPPGQVGGQVTGFKRLGSEIIHVVQNKT